MGKRTVKSLVAFLLPITWLCASVPIAAGEAVANPCSLGETWLRPSSISTLPDGGQLDTYLIDGIANKVPVPPKTFDPLTASDATLSTYGFPPRPTDAADLASWNAEMAGWTWSADTGLCQTNKRAAYISSFVWSGYYVHRNTSPLYIAVQGDYHQPHKDPTSCSNSQEVSWVGIGGEDEPRLIQAGTGIDTDASKYAWYEYLYFDSQGHFHGINLTKLPAVDVHAGDSIHTYVVHQTSGNGQTTFYVADNTTGTQKSVVVDLSSSYYDGHTAEWIDERPTLGGVPTPLTNFDHVNWTNTRAQKSDATWHTLGSQTYVQVRMTLPDTLAYPDPISSNTTFTDRWYDCE